MSSSISMNNFQTSNFNEIKALLLDDRVSLSQVKNHIESELEIRKRKKDAHRKEEALRLQHQQEQQQALLSLHQQQSGGGGGGTSVMMTMLEEPNRKKNAVSTSPTKMKSLANNINNHNSSHKQHSNYVSHHTDEDLTSIIAELGAKAKKQQQQASSSSSTNDTEAEHVEKLRKWKPVTVSDPSGTHAVIQADVAKAGMSRIEKMWVEDRAPRNRKCLLTPRFVQEPEDVVRDRLRAQRQGELESAYQEMGKALTNVAAITEASSLNRNFPTSAYSSALFSPIRSVLSSVVSTPPLPQGWTKSSLNIITSQNNNNNINNNNTSNAMLPPSVLSQTPNPNNGNNNISSSSYYFSENEIAALVGRPALIWEGDERTLSAPPPATSLVGGAQTISRRLRQLRNDAALQSTIEMGGSTHDKGKLLQETAYLPAKMRRDVTVGALTILGQTQTYRTIQLEKKKREREKLDKKLEDEKTKERNKMDSFENNRRKSFVNYYGANDGNNQLGENDDGDDHDGTELQDQNENTDFQEAEDEEARQKPQKYLTELDDQLVFGNYPEAFVQLIPARRKYNARMLLMNEQSSNNNANENQGSRMSKPVKLFAMTKRKNSTSGPLATILPSENHQHIEAKNPTSTSLITSPSGNLATVLFGGTNEANQNENQFKSHNTFALEDTSFDGSAASFGSSPSSVLVDQQKRKLRKRLPFSAAPDAPIPWTCSISEIVSHILEEAFHKTSKQRDSIGFSLFSFDAQKNNDSSLMLLPSNSSMLDHQQFTESTKIDDALKQIRGKNQDPNLEQQQQQNANEELLQLDKFQENFASVALMEAEEISRVYFAFLEYGLQDFYHKQKVTKVHFPWEDDQKTKGFFEGLKRTIMMSRRSQLMKKIEKEKNNKNNNKTDITSDLDDDDGEKEETEEKERETNFAPESKRNLKGWIFTLRKALDRAVGELEVDAEDDTIEDQERAIALALAKKQQKHFQQQNHHDNMNNNTMNNTVTNTRTNSANSAKNVPHETVTTTNSKGIILLAKEEKKLLIRDVFGGLDRVISANVVSSSSINFENNNDNSSSGVFSNSDPQLLQQQQQNDMNTEVVTKQQGQASFQAAQKLGMIEPLLNKLPTTFLFSKSAATIIKGFSSVDLIVKQQQQKIAAQAAQFQRPSSTNQVLQKTRKSGGASASPARRKSSASSASPAPTTATKKNANGAQDGDDDEEEERENLRLDGNFVKYLDMTRGNREHLKEMKTEENFARGIVLQAQSTLHRMKARCEHARSEARKKLHEKLEERRKAAENLLSHRRAATGQSMVNDIAENAERRAKVWKLLRLPPQTVAPTSSTPNNNDNSVMASVENNHNNGSAGMWEIRLEAVEKNEKSAQQCRLFCIRATLALFSTSFPPSREAIAMLSNFCDGILRSHSQLTPSQFLRWLKKCRDIILMIHQPENNQSNHNNNQFCKSPMPRSSEAASSSRNSPQKSLKASPAQNNLAVDLSPIEKNLLDHDHHQKIAVSVSQQLPWDCVFLQGWIRAELGVTAKSHVAWSELPAQRSTGWKIDPVLV